MLNHRIYLSEHGALVLCPATGTTYLPIGARWSVFGDTLCLWSDCIYCDCYGKHPGDPDYAPAEPQPHVHCLEASHA